VSVKIGDRIEAKLEPGLGNWCSVTVVASHRDTVTVDRDGRQYEVPRRRVRVPKAKSKPMKSRRCSYCKEVGHDIRNCERLTGFAESIRTDGPVNVISRSFDTERPQLNPQPKPPSAVRSDAYLAFVRSKSCMWCGSPPPSDPDHIGPHGLARKTDDLRTIPTCRRHHNERHDTGTVRPHRRGTLMAVVHAKQVDLLIEFFHTGGGI
jgi:hypothetical protein